MINQIETGILDFNHVTESEENSDTNPVSESEDSFEYEFTTTLQSSDHSACHNTNCCFGTAKNGWDVSCKNHITDMINLGLPSCLPMMTGHYIKVSKV